MGSGVGSERYQRTWLGLVAGTLAGLIVLDLDLASLLSFRGDRTFLVPVGALLGATLWSTRLRGLATCAVSLLAVLWLAVAFTPLAAWMRDGLVRSDPIQAGDAVFVFASRVQDDGDPDTAAMSRLLRGVELVHDGRSSHLVISEIPHPHARYAPIAEAWVRRFAPDSQVIAVGPVLNTRDEAVAVARLFHQRGWTRVLAVTSPTHTRRAAATLEAQGLEVVSVPAVETDFDVEALARPGDRRAGFSRVAHERLGLLVYRRRGWID